MNKKFKPMLATNEKKDTNNLIYPYLKSIKRDGIRCIFKEIDMISRSLKQIRNIRLQEKFTKLKEFVNKEGIILEGELYSHDLTFQEINSVVMSKDKKVPDSVKLYVFDMLKDEESYDMKFSERYSLLQEYTKDFKDIVVCIKQEKALNSADVLKSYDEALENGYEGLILKDPNGHYKFGRTTLNDGLMYKLKPFGKNVGIIKEVLQSTVAREGSEKKINELGRSETSKKKGDRVLIEMASAFLVCWKGIEFKATMKASHEEKKQIWKDRESFIGKDVEFESMDVGVKNKPRHPVAIKW
jgi:DNA ligase 1